MIEMFFLGSFQAYCSYANVFEDWEITTVVSYDIMFEFIMFFNRNILIGTLYNLPSTYIENNAAKMIVTQVNTNCTQQVNDSDSLVLVVCIYRQHMRTFR